MTAYYVDSSRTGGADTGGSWTDAFLTLIQATAVATATDIIYVDDGHAESRTTALALVFPATTGLIIASVDSALGLTPTAVSAGARVEISTGNVGMTFDGCAYIYGTTFLGTASTTTAGSISFGSGVTRPTVITADTCSFQVRSANIAAVIGFGGTSASTSDECEVIWINTTFGVAISTSGLAPIRARILMRECSLIGTAPTSLFLCKANAGFEVEAIGCDFGTAGYTNLVSASVSNVFATLRFAQCKRAASTTPLLTSQVANGVRVFLHDCHSGDTHIQYEYHDAMGSLVSDTGIYFTSGAAAQSWKITTTANANFANPFKTPFFGYYNTTLSAITPYIEILRDGSTTEYQDDEVWLDVMAKATASSTQSTFRTDRKDLLAAAANQAAGAGLGSWTGEGGTAWSGKIGLGSSITPAENGHIQARIVVGEPSITVYADPQIRT